MSHPSCICGISMGVWHALKKPGFNETRPLLPARQQEPATTVHLPRGGGGGRAPCPCCCATLGAVPAASIPAEAAGHPGPDEVPQLHHLSFSSLLHLAPLTSPSEEPGFGVGKMSLGFSQIQYPLEPKPISLAQGPAIEGPSLLFKPPRAQLL